MALDSQHSVIILPWADRISRAAGCRSSRSQAALAILSIIIIKSRQSDRV